MVGSIQVDPSPLERFANLCAAHLYTTVARGESVPYPLFVVKSACVSFLVLMCPLTVVLNLLVILAVKQKRYLKKKHQVLLACLAGTDLITGTITQPLLITSNLLQLLGVGSNCLIEFVLNLIYFLSVGASVHHLVIISGERYIAIRHALRYEILVTTRRITFTVALAWLLPACGFAMFNVLLLFGGGSIINNLFGIFAFITLSLSLFAISFCQHAVLRECNRHLQHITLHLVSESGALEQFKKHKAARTTLYIVLSFFLCFSPQIVFFGGIQPLNPPESFVLAVISVMDVLVVSNSLINPVIYCARTEEFKRAFREFLPLGNSEARVAVVDGEERSRRRRRQWRARVSPLATTGNSSYESRIVRVRSHSSEGVRYGTQDG